MLLAVDAGNTNIVFAVFDGGPKPLHVWRIQTNAGRTGDEYTAWLSQLFELGDLGRADITDILISSVVPDANFNLRKFCEAMFGLAPLFVGKDKMDHGVVIDLPRPEELGADRIVNTAAVLKDYKVPAIVIDCGTATTFDVINEKGHFIGGVIAPGANLSMTALHMAAAQLPKVAIAKPDAAIANTTVSAMQAGVYWGYVGLIEGLVRQITIELGAKPFVLGTGGLVSLFAEETDIIDKIDPDLTLRGLYYIYLRNR
jgi:type III pantothenate kinase